MEQLLSQEEIDALLKGISEGDVEAAVEEVQVEAEQTPKPAIKAQILDFAKYTKGRKEKLPSLEFISDRLSKSLRSALTLFLEREVDINIAPTQYVEYGEFIKTLPSADKHEHRHHGAPQRVLHSDFRRKIDLLRP